MLLRTFIFLSLIRCVFMTDTSNYANLFRTQRSCSKIEYFDKSHHKCREFPGGGYLIIVDHSAKCTDGDSGLHTFNRNDFYYVCHQDGVMIGMCPNDMKFNDTLGRCVPRVDELPETIRIYDESENCGVLIPNCNKNGKFPVPSNCSFYYDCQRNRQNYLQYVYRCPCETMYHPDLHRCVAMANCYVDHFDMFDRFDYELFPKCVLSGQFRTSRNCNLYYRCIPNMDGSFFQIRYECPPMTFYNVDLESCQTKYLTHCEYTPWSKIVKDYAEKHDLRCDTYEPQPTTSICTLNTTISTSTSTTETTLVSTNTTNVSVTTETIHSTTPNAETSDSEETDFEIVSSTIANEPSTNSSDETESPSTETTYETENTEPTNATDDHETSDVTEAYSDTTSSGTDLTTESEYTEDDTTSSITDEQSSSTATHSSSSTVTSNPLTSYTIPYTKSTSKYTRPYRSSEEYDSYEIFTWDDNSWRPTKSPSNPTDESNASEKNDSNNRPVRCFNNRHGGLTCEGIEGKPGGWLELPGYSIRYQKRPGASGKKNQRLNADVSLRLRYPHAYRFEAYPKKRNVDT